MKYLLDTNVISELRRKVPNIQVIEWLEKIDPNQLYLSCITIGEIKMGALKKAKKDQATGKLLLKWLEDLIKEYQEQIVEVDLATCEQWAEFLVIDATNAIDSLIAAQCTQMNMILVTRNIKHFKMFDIKYFNPFGDENAT